MVFLRRFLFGKDRPWEQRQYPRRLTNSLLALDRAPGTTMPGTEKSEKPICNLVDISEGGIQFSSPKKLERGSLFSCDIELVEKDVRIPVLAKVVWVRPRRKCRGIYHVGACFLSIREEASALIRNFVTTPSRN